MEKQTYRGERYTDDDITGFYRGCKHPKEQIKIISQLTLRSESEIINVLKKSENVLK